MNVAAKLIGHAIVLGVLATTIAGAAPPQPSGLEIKVSGDDSRSHHLPQVAVFPDGGFVVVWSTSFGELMARFFDQHGAPTGGERRLSIGRATYIEDVVVERGGSFLVAANQTGPGAGTNVLVQRYSRSGKARGAPIVANDSRVTYRGFAVLASAPGGGFAVAWVSEVGFVGPGGAYLDTVGRIFDARRRPRGPEVVLLAGVPATTGFPNDQRNAFPLALALAPDGTLTVLAQHLAPCVRNFLLRLRPGARHVVDAGLGSTACAGGRSRGSLALFRDGSLVAAWREDAVRARRFAPGGAPRDEPFAVSERPGATESDPSLALQGDGFVVAWTDGGGRDGDGSGIFARAFTKGGAPITADFQVNVTATGEQTNPRIAATRRGPAVVVWTQQLDPPLGRSHVFARVLGSSP